MNKYTHFPSGDHEEMAEVVSLKNTVVIEFRQRRVTPEQRKAQYTPPTTRLNCRVASGRRRRCEQNSQLAHDDCRRTRSTIWKLTKQTP